MHDALNRAHPASTLAAQAPQRDGAAPGPTAAARPSGIRIRWAFVALGRLLGRNAMTDHVEAEPLDEHTLNDIGFSRIDVLYVDPNPAVGRSSAGSYGEPGHGNHFAGYRVQLTDI